MSRQEFLQRLRQALTGQVPGNVMEENIKYYDEYISAEMGKGRTEEEVTASIGDPRLIARTIMDASENAKDTSYSEEGRTVYEENADSGKSIHYVNLNKWYWKLLGVIAVVLFFTLLFSVVSGIFTLLMPIMGPVLLILLVMWFFRGMRR